MAAQYQVAGRTAAEIIRSVETGIRTGALPTGAGLPAVRALAGELAVSPATVAKAYQALRQRGLVATAGRHGTRVRARPPIAARRWAQRPDVPAGTLDLSTGEPDRRLLPPLGPHVAAVATRIGHSTEYADGGVLPELADRARQRLTADGIPAGEIVVTGGALDGIERLLSAHLSPGDPVAVEDPGWANLLDLVATLGLRPVGVPVDDAGPTPAGLRAALAAGARALVVTSRAQNPTGAAVTARRAAQLRAELAGHPDLLLIEDDHAADLAPVPPHSLGGATASWAFVRSTSKPYGPDLRLAVVTGDDTSTARVAGRLRVGAGWVSTLLQRVVLELWSDPGTADLVATARDRYADRLAALRDALAGHGVASHGGTGLNVWVPVPDETRAVTGLRDAGYAVAPGSLFRLSSPPGIRITVSRLAGPRIGPLADAVARVLAGGPARGFTA